MRYRHYNGGEYELIGIAHEEATGDAVVVYRSYADGTLWTRPEASFFGDIALLGDADHPLPNDRPVLRNDGAYYIVRRFIPLPPPPK